jgi:hypothetical protein
LIIDLMNQIIADSHTEFSQLNAGSDFFGRLDQLAYEFFCLSEDEITLIEDSLCSIIPSVQPHEKQVSATLHPASPDIRKAYAETLARSLDDWLRGGERVSARLEAIGPDLGVLKLTLGDKSTPYSENSSASLAATLAELSKHIRQPLDGNFQLMPDLRIFVGNDLYLIKPMQRRFWLRSAALADADAIALDLQDFVRPKASAG